MDKCMPLRYRISDWRQLPECQSNNSRELHLSVTEFVNDDRLSGLCIQVNHDCFGVLFACTIHSYGSIITPGQEGSVYECTTGQILAELHKYGFFITYNPVKNLNGHQLEYLMTLRNLQYDKIRVLGIWKHNGVSKEFRSCVVAFNVDKNPEWLSNNYTASEKEYVNALNEGSAINVSAISADRYDWNWLNGWVANIDDILAENSEVLI